MGEVNTRAYYNENDPFAAAWLRNLIAENLIAPGDVDERSIVDVKADDLKDYTQCHFFAGIGGWSYALRLAGWPDNRPVWTGSCPCQPFSVASVGHGGAKGQCDERHLWPEFHRLIRKRRPLHVIGEQVDDAIGWGWWDLVAMDFEDEGYACAAQVLRADAAGGTHQRKRLYWVADSSGAGWQGYKQRDRISLREEETFTVNGNALVRAKRALAGDYIDLLPGDGVPVAVERLRAKGYGNAVVPQVAAGFIKAVMDCIPMIDASRSPLREAVE